MIGSEPTRYPHWQRTGDPIRTARETFRHRHFLAGIDSNDKLLIDIVLKPWNDGEYYRKESWTSATTAEIIATGYKQASGLVTGFSWRRIGTFVKIHNDRVFDIYAHEGEKDADGYPLYSMDTAATLNDFLENNAESRFTRGMGETRLDSGAIVKIIAMGAVAMVGVMVAFLMGVI